MPASLATPAADTLVLGIETSCDETACAVIARAASGHGRILSNIVRSQFERHQAFGGVVPEIAARAHVEILDTLIASAITDAGLGFDRLHAVAATAGPGLVGGLIVGLVTGKAIALARGLPFLAINHLEAHALTVGLSDGLSPPYLLLLVSGGHTQILLVHGVGRYTRLATTIDDALGEAFDKTAKLLGLGLPGGPAVEACAKSGNPARFSLPRPMLGRPEPHFSFAGLKTAVRLRAAECSPLSPRDVADLCASFEQAVLDCVTDRVGRALSVARNSLPADPQPALVVAGGVAANMRLRAGLKALAEAAGLRLVVPPVALCGDNAAMIAWAGAERLALGDRDPWDAPVRPRWPLDPAAPPAIGAGAKG